MGLAKKDWELIQEVTAYFLSTKSEKQPTGSIRMTALHFGLTRLKVQ